GAVPARGDEGARAYLHVFSSGTTGTPKRMAFTHRGLVAHAEKYERHIGLGARDRFVPPSPFPSKTGLRYVRIAHVAGAAFVNARFPRTKSELAQLVRDQGVTITVCAPVQLRLLLDTDLPAGERLPPFRLLSG